MHIPVAVAAKDHRPARDGACLVITWVTNLRGVPHIDPTAIEHRALLALENLARYEDLAVDREGQFLAALAHERAAIMVSGAGVSEADMLIVHRRRPSDRPIIQQAVS